MHMHMRDYMHLMRSNQDSLGTGMSLIAIVMSKCKLWNARTKLSAGVREYRRRPYCC